ncbi:hypothetical protein CK203_019574 [Vitis vinifera]|uniref:Uncharacterized protein n=1 Tax=Vitis vinifera TaxID=29760 RepID=A0A438IZ23_VITVI|nr:hypothetical protein CK203_019574 [Vitis vinifera]
MEAVLPVEIEIGSLRVALEQQIPEMDWAQARFDQLNLLDERRLRQQTTFVHIKGRWPALSKSGSSPDHCMELTPEGAAWLMDLDGNRFSEPTNVDQLKSFLSFLSPYHPSLRYVPCLKTTLRPWDQISSSTASAWTGLIQLCSDYRDPPEIHPARSALLDTWMPSCLSIWEILVELCAYPHSRDLCRDDDLFTVFTMIPQWGFSGVTQLGLHFSMLRCHHAFLPGDAPLIYGFDSIVYMDDLDCAFDDG